MAECVGCRKRSWFLVVASNNRLCQSCNSAWSFMAPQHVRIIEESERLIEKSKSPNTILNRIDVLLEHASKLCDLAEEYGQQKTIISAQQIITEYTAMAQQIFLDSVEDKVTAAQSKSSLAKTLSSKLSPIQGTILVVQEARKRYPEVIELEAREHELLDMLRQIQFEDLAMQGEKEAFKGNLKKAIDKFKDALFQVKTDDVPDEQQADLIRNLEMRILELEASAPAKPK